MKPWRFGYGRGIWRTNEARFRIIFSNLHVLFLTRDLLESSLLSKICYSMLESISVLLSVSPSKIQSISNLLVNGNHHTSTVKIKRHRIKFRSKSLFLPCSSKNVLGFRPLQLGASPVDHRNYVVIGWPRRRVVRRTSPEVTS